MLEFSFSEVAINIKPFIPTLEDRPVVWDHSWLVGPLRPRHQFMREITALHFSPLSDKGHASRSCRRSWRYPCNWRKRSQAQSCVVTLSYYLICRVIPVTLGSLREIKCKFWMKISNICWTHSDELRTSFVFAQSLIRTVSMLTWPVHGAGVSRRSTPASLCAECPHAKCCSGKLAPTAW